MGDHHKHAAWCGSRRKIQKYDARNFPKESARSPMRLLSLSSNRARVVAWRLKTDSR
jgi:hypothetical protein